MSRQIMFRTRYIKTFILAVAAVAAACTADPADPVSPDYDAEPVSLTIDISIADLGIDVETRAEGDTSTPTTPTTPTTPPTFSSALSSDVAKYLDPDYPGPVPTEDPELTYYNKAKSIDGSVMTCLTVILVHRKTDRIVGIRRIPDMNCPNKSGQDDPKNALFDEKDNVVTFDESGNPSNGATHARITFDYENPFHVVTQEMVDKLVEKATTEEEKNAIRAANEPYIGKSAERLVRGEYSILVVANYNHNVTTSSENPNKQTMNVNRVLSDIADKFHEPQYMVEGIPGFNSTYKYFYDIRFLMNRTLQRVKPDDGIDLNDVFKVVDLPIKDEDGNPIKPYIRPAVQQTLSAAKEIYLEANKNHLELELLRISSRTRVEVKNNSTTPLKVHSLSFSNNYTQSTCYLFRRNKNDRDYSELTTHKYTDTYYTDHDGKGAPMVSYTGMVDPSLNATTYGAIVPFLPDWDSNSDNVMDGVKVEPNAKKCIFDALMYESNVNYKDDPKEGEPEEPDSYTYTIVVSYPQVENYKTTDQTKLEDGWDTENDYERATFDYAIKDENGAPQYISIPNGSSVEYVYNKIKEIEQNCGHPCYFLIEGVVNKNRFLYEKEDGTLRAATTDITLTTEGIDIKSYLWSLDELKDDDGNYYCYLKNIRSEKHMPNIPQDKEVNPADGGTPMKSTDEASQKYKLGVSDLDNGQNHTGVFNVTFSNTFSGSQHGTYYLSVWKGETYLSGWNVADPGCQYRLYPIKLIPATVYVGTPKPIEKTVKLTTFSDETGIVEDVREIQRNDFVRILVEVSYNPKKGDIDFEVNSWVKNPDGTDKGGEVSFN